MTEQLQELRSGETVVGPPKSDAGRRTVAIPSVLLGSVVDHLDRFCGPEAAALVFRSTSGGPLSLKTFHRHWRRALAAVGLTGFRFHDLRHTANTLSAMTGASTRELMARMGHSSARAALIYQHATSEREVAIAGAVSDLIAPLLRDPT